jgi:cell wall-associated NlpC family hydrolase
VSTRASSPDPPGYTAAETNAVNWAKTYVGTATDNGLCLTFVFAAYSAAGVNLRNYVNVPIGSDTFPADIWGHFTAGTTGGGSTPPYGALVFWASNPSHVALSLGGGQLISTSDAVNEAGVHYETMAQHAYAPELGWWLPA